MKSSPLRFTELSRLARITLLRHHHGMGLGILIVSLFLVSVLAGLNPPTETRVFMEGEVADSNVIAHRSLVVEDSQATQTKRDQMAMVQPTVFDLSVSEIAAMRDKIFGLLKTLNEADPGAQPDDVRRKLSEKLGEPVSLEVMELWMQPDVQEYILGMALPWMEDRLREGVVSDARLALPSKNGILVRDMDTGTETLRPNAADIRDVPAVLAAFTQKLRADSGLPLQARRAVITLFSPLAMPTLTLNREATLSLGNAVAQTVEPVRYNILQGEIVVYQGERITREKQLKLQALYQKKEGMFHSRLIAGLFLFSLLFTTGFFMAPSGKPGTPLQKKDFVFISLVLLSCGIAAKGSYLLLGKLVQPQDMVTYIHFFPAAGASGLCALIFAARRYCVMGILLSMFTCAMMNVGLPLFLFFFLSSMLNTWLVIRAQNRQDVVLSLIPLALGTILISIASGWLEGFQGAEAFLYLAAVATVNAVISVFMLFAFSPIIEMLFRYTTRFRLMELMNLEQPLLQDLMVAIPGTYHHSPVVSNMVEAGAKSVGANSLLCKVGALYHDIGKLAYPDYYIENQFNGPNRHDKLAPAMSALILLSHVKKGTELGRQHHLGAEIEEIISQHHGTSLIRFFYNKAKELGENPRIEDYCYPGPRPQSREAAIVMLADAVEASSRTLSDPTPARLKTHVDTIMKGIFSEGQLDESELTFRDLHLLSENFARILTGLFHQRIAYPDITKEKKLPEKGEDNTRPIKTPAACSPLSSQEARLKPVIKASGSDKTGERDSLEAQKTAPSSAQPATAAPLAPPSGAPAASNPQISSPAPKAASGQGTL